MESRNNVWSVVLAVVITALIVGGGMYWWQQREVVKNPTVATSDILKEPTVEAPRITESSYRYDVPEWREALEATLKTKNEKIESFYASGMPDETAFISTSADVSGKWSDMKSDNKIYSYNTTTSELIKLYEEQQQERLLRPMGMEGQKLIVMYDLIDNSPGPCFSVWADWKNFGYVDTENPGKLSPYTVPEYQVQKAKDEQKKCEKDMLEQ